MLRPKRKTTRRDLKRDPLLETLFGLQKLYDRNRRTVRTVVLGGAAVVVVILMMLGWRSSVTQSAGEIFARSLSRYNTGDWAAARDDFEVLVDEYSGTTAGADALYYLGQIYLDSDDSASAEAAFLKYTKRGDNVFLKAASLESLANVALFRGKHEEAARLFLRAASLPTFPFNQQQNRISAAECWLKAGRPDKARILLNELKSLGDVHRVIQDQIDELSAYIQVTVHPSS